MSIEIIAALLSGFLGGLAAILANALDIISFDRLDRRKKRRDLVYQIFANRHIVSKNSDVDDVSYHQAVSAINQITITFADFPEVIDPYDNFMDIRSDKNLTSLLRKLADSTNLKNRISDRHVLKYFDRNRVRVAR